MGLKFGFRKLGISREAWAARNTVFTKTAGGKFGPRKVGGLKPDQIPVDPALRPSDAERFDPPPATQIGKLPVSAAIAAVQSEVTDLGTMLASEIHDRAARKQEPRKTVLSAIRDLAEARKNANVRALAESELERLAAEAAEAE